MSFAAKERAKAAQVALVIPTRTSMRHFRMPTSREKAKVASPQARGLAAR